MAFSDEPGGQRAVTVEQAAAADPSAKAVAARAWAKRLGRIGIWHHDLERLPAKNEQATVRELEQLGYRAVWIPESLGSKEIFAHSGILLHGTERLIVAPGIANIWARDAVAMANGMRALTEAHPERFVLGMGVSHAPTVQLRGQRYGKPVERMREYLDAMEKAPYTGPKLEGPAPVVLAALGPRMLRLSAERTLGAHSYFVPVEHTPLARRDLGPEALLVVEQGVVLSTDPNIARTAARRHMKRYLELENYTNNLRRLGWSDADLANGGSDRLVDAIVAWGNREAIKARIDAHLNGGADHVCLQALRTEPSAPPTRDYAELAKLL